METRAFYTWGTFQRERQTELLACCSRGLSKSSLVLPLISVWFLFGSLSLLQLSGQQRCLQQTNSCATEREKSKTKRSKRGKLPFPAQVSSLESCFRVCLCHRMTYYLCLHVFCVDGLTTGQFDISSHYQRQKGKRLQGIAAITHTISETRYHYASGVSRGVSTTGLCHAYNCWISRLTH